MTFNADEKFPVREGEGPSFILCGREWHTKQHLHPSWFLEEKEGVAQVVDFISRCLVPGERDDFHALINDPDTPIHLDQLGEIANYILGEISGRPTQAADSSGPGEETTS